MRWFAIVLIAAPAWACQCREWPSPREAWEDSELVFIGRMESSRPVILDRPSIEHIQIVKMRVEEPFKGVVRGQQVTLHQRISSCSGAPREGIRGLFYLHRAREANSWFAPRCHRSRAVENAADDLLFLRALPGSLKLNRISGEVRSTEHSPTHGFRSLPSLAGVRVTITRANGVIAETKSNADGVYEVYGLPAGAYTVDIEPPARTTVSSAYPMGRDNPARGGREIRLRDGGGSGVTFYLTVDNQMSGRIFDPSGNPMKDVCVDLEPVVSKPASDFHIYGCSDPQGRFVLKHMPAGAYRLAINRRGPSPKAPFDTLYYPATKDPGEATVLTIGEGEHRDGLDIRIPEVQRVIRISGRVQFADGAGVPLAWVTFEDAEGNRRESAGADTEGIFEIPILAGAPGEVRAQLMRGVDKAAKCASGHPRLNPQVPGRPSILLSDTLKVQGDHDQLGITLAFDFPSCPIL